MSQVQLGSVLRNIRRLFGGPLVAGLTDRQLLQRFAATRDDAAFEGLVRRHGNMVYCVCRRVLGDAHAADDAFQATFFVLAKKAGSLLWHESVAGWLYAVAQRVALKARLAESRRQAQERRAADMPTDIDPNDGGADLSHGRTDNRNPFHEAARHELQLMVGEEIQRLPEKYRGPLVLCYLEGKSNEEAARELGRPAGSMSRHLTRARELLRARLAKRGVALSTAGIVSLLSEGTAAAMPVRLIEITVQHALLFATGTGATAAIGSAEAAALAEGVLENMLIAKFKTTVAVLVTLGVFTLGTGGIMHQFSQAQTARDKAPAAGDSAPPVKGADGAAAVKQAKSAEAKATGQTAELRRKLARTLDKELPSDQIPLKDALEYISKTFEVPIYIDKPLISRVAQLNKDIDEHQVMMPNVKGITLGTALRMVLAQVGEQEEVTYRIQPGYVEVTAQARLRPADWAAEHLEIDEPQRFDPAIMAVLAPRVDVDFEDRPLNEALRELSEMTGVNIVIDVRAKDQAKSRVSAHLTDVPLDNALKVLADMAELSEVVVGKVFYVTTKKNAEALAAERNNRRHATLGAGMGGLGMGGFGMMGGGVGVSGGGPGVQGGLGRAGSSGPATPPAAAPPAKPAEPEKKTPPGKGQ